MNKHRVIVKDYFYTQNKAKCESAEFIQAVRNNPALYDPDNNDYKSKPMKDMIWSELASQFGVTDDVARKRWKSMRDSFTKKYRISEEHANAFKFGQELLFLVPYMRSERTQTTQKPKTETNNESTEQDSFQNSELLDQSSEARDVLNQVDIRVFIEQVKDQEKIWNEQSYTHGLAGERYDAWVQICQNLLQDFELLSSATQNELINGFRKKWRSLRDRYTSIKRISQTRPEDFQPNRSFMYFNDLKFLDINTKRKRETSPEPEEPDEVELTEIDANKSLYTLQLKNESLNNYTDTNDNNSVDDDEMIEVDDLNTTKQETDEDDADKAFLLSLVKEMKKIPSVHKIDARLNILVVLRQWQRKHYGDDINGVNKLF